MPTAALAAARWRQRSINLNETLTLAPQARPHRVAFTDVISLPTHLGGNHKTGGEGM